jgi:hypothetical protein
MSLPPSAAAEVASVHSLVVQLLGWVDDTPRSYAETIEAWRTSCPRLPVWEHAVGEGLLKVEPGIGGRRAACVVVTPKGRGLLASSAGAAG